MTNNKRDDSIEHWIRKNRPDLLPQLPEWFQNQGANALLAIAFEAGRQFQNDTGAELNNPNIYDRAFPQSGRMIRFNLPRGMTRVQVAQTFTAYLIGPLTFDNRVNNDGEFARGPYMKDRNLKNDADWQLDGTNNFFLHFKEDHAILSFRYDSPSQERTARILVALFTLRFLS